MSFRTIRGSVFLYHGASLRRTAVGSFSEAEAAPVERTPLLPLAAGLRDFGAVVVSDEIAAAVGFGKVLDRSDFAGGPIEATAFPDGLTGDGPWPKPSWAAQLTNCCAPAAGRC